MISSQAFDELSPGGFITVVLDRGPTLQGYAAQDPDYVQFLRLDGFLAEDDGSVSQFSMRLEREQIEDVRILAEPPEITDSAGKVYRMNPAFWEDLE